MSATNLPMLFRLDGTVAAVTGGDSGIGQASVRALAEAGATVVVLDRAPQEGEAVERITVDVADAEAVRAAFDAIAARHGRLDILVNSAGTAIRKPALDVSVEDWNTVVAVNMTGSFLCAREAARLMIAAGRPGAIVNVASIMGLSGGGLYPNISYQTTKGAIVNMTRALAVEWAPNGIRVNAVAPTYVRTPFIRSLLDQPELMRRIEEMTPLRRLADPEDIAAAILYLASPAAAMVTGHTLPVDGGFLAQ
ncbi:SDR family NAD(P)-dependent oxidoreductase [Chelatococcus sp. GCM10030263]|uniref:SDR family NAD(P)-dependent oxidoreductase n=1 Tax=Chelatococcus sp. GCM10030263 TaxID=3273387 RepID=UPI00361DC139